MRIKGNFHEFPSKDGLGVELAYNEVEMTKERR